MEHQKNCSHMNWSLHNPNTTKAKKSPKVTYNRLRFVRLPSVGGMLPLKLFHITSLHTYPQQAFFRKTLHSLIACTKYYDFMMRGITHHPPLRVSKYIYYCNKQEKSSSPPFFSNDCLLAIDGSSNDDGCWNCETHRIMRWERFPRSGTNVPPSPNWKRRLHNENNMGFSSSIKRVVIFVELITFLKPQTKINNGGKIQFIRKELKTIMTPFLSPSAEGCYCWNTISKPQNWKTDNWACIFNLKIYTNMTLFFLSLLKPQSLSKPTN